MGRKVLNATSKPAFLRAGNSRASLQSLANCPVSKDRFIIVVITGMRTSNNCARTEDGIGSTGQHLMGALVINAQTSSSDTSLKDVNKDVTAGFVKGILNAVFEACAAGSSFATPDSHGRAESISRVL